MNCNELANRIEELQPGADTREVARLCLLLSNAVQQTDELENEQTMAQVWQDTGLRLQAASDQHAAMTAELEELAQSDPRSFSPDQIWILIRAIKVQSQMLQFYVAGTPLDV